MPTSSRWSTSASGRSAPCSRSRSRRRPRASRSRPTGAGSRSRRWRARTCSRADPAATSSAPCRCSRSSDGAAVKVNEVPGGEAAQGARVHAGQQDGDRPVRRREARSRSTRSATASSSTRASASSSPPGRCRSARCRVEARPAIGRARAARAVSPAGMTARAGGAAALSGSAFATLLLIALMMGANHVAARVAFDHGVDVATAVSVRSTITALVVGALLFVQRVPLALTRRHRRALPAIGLLIGVQSLCLYSSVARLPVALALLAFNTYPLWTALWARAAVCEPTRAARRPGDAGDAGRPRPRPRRPRRRLRPRRDRAVAADRRRRRVRARRGGDVRPRARLHPARGRRPRRPAAHADDDVDRRRDRGRRGDARRAASTCRTPAPAGGAWRR